MIEIEKRYLIKEIPEGLFNCQKREMIDIYIPSDSKHPKIRIRKNGDKFEITKKAPSLENPKYMEEQTIIISEEEFDLLNNEIAGKRIEKIRYKYDWHGQQADVDIFQGDLKGLAIADFEFELQDSEEKFEMPEFCLADITNEPEKITAGGMLCGKKFEDIFHKIKKYNYKPIYLD